jgi:uncharacterized protein (TIGR00369 family)
MEIPIDIRQGKPLANRDDHRCFACGPNNPAGLRMQFFTDEQSVFSSVQVPEHLCGWDNLVHGGVITTMLDEIMSWAAIYLLKTIILTKSVQVDFLKPLFIGAAVTVVGRVRERISSNEAVMEGVLYNADGNLCSRSTGTFALIKPKVAQKLGVMGEEGIKSFEVIINS